MSVVQYFARTFYFTARHMLISQIRFSIYPIYEY